MEMWYGAVGEPMDMDDVVDKEPNVLTDVPAASESDEEEMGSASACASTLSRRERLMNSSPDGWGTVEGENEGAQRAVIDEARLGKSDNSRVLLVKWAEIGEDDSEKLEKDKFKTSTARAATRTAEQTKRV